MIFGLMAWGAWLTMAQTLLTSATVVFGASYVDLHANLPVLRISIALLVLGAGLAIWHGFGGRGWAIPLAVGLYLAVSIAGGLYAGLIQGFVVSPNESSKEQEFIQYNIAATRRAYALDRVDERELSGDAQLTPDGDCQRRHHSERQAVGSRPAPADVLADTGDRTSTISSRSTTTLHHQRPGASGDALGAGLNTELLPNHSFVNERLTFTPVTASPSARSTRSRPRAARAVHPEPAAGDDGGASNHRAEPVFR
jgi:hypothetical protein